ncbi:flavodoxin family protein [Nocardioides caeni]|uniref:Flavodoxin family protein n=1 Tax=Nocardioides caeni TaxID=574700 RepID=A0A4S8NPC0_9ACTN|nr:NAD(P)H-dependent oxidoreductase [Nocardioides caeni]THV18311.1 flavodoxin family protein [Nocardioides caeni]
MTRLRALVLSCSLRPSPSPSSSEQLGREFLDALGEHDVDGTVVRVVDHDVAFGVSVDEGDGDAWPAIRREMLESEILVIATPIWMGQPSSVCKMVLERLDAELAETDDRGRMLTWGKVAAIAVVGNEDGAHHVVAECAQALSDVGFTIAANGSTYWVGEAMQGVDYQDLDGGAEKTHDATRTAARTTAHLARLLRAHPYPSGDVGQADAD